MMFGGYDQARVDRVAGKLSKKPGGPRIPRSLSGPVETVGGIRYAPITHAAPGYQPGRRSPPWRGSGRVTDIQDRRSWGGNSPGDDIRRGA